MIKGIFFDLNGTLIDILTTESDDAVWRTTANFLSYAGVMISFDKLKESYFDLNKQQRRESKEEFPEFDVKKIFADIIRQYAKPPLSPETAEAKAAETAVVFRAASRLKLELYPGVREVLEQLKNRYLLAAVSDGQTLWAVPEMRAAGLEEYFSIVTVSGDFGYRKPDLRMYRHALEHFSLKPQEVIFVGNDMYRDVFGAAQAGMQTVFFKSNQGDQSSHGTEADYIIYHFSELLNAIAFLEEKSSGKL